jgi:hypothetical protein
MKQFLCTLFILFFGGLFVFGQVEKKFYPDKNALETIKFLKGKELVHKYIQMPSFDLERLKKEDKEIEGLDVPYRFGNGFDVSYTLDDGEWFDCDNGRVWNISFKSNGALSSFN